jgi:hypothetical protein
MLRVARQQIIRACCQDVGELPVRLGGWQVSQVSMLTRASDLLAVVITLPLLQLQTGQEIWSRDQVEEAGQLFLTWSHEIRHQGTFSKISLAFGQVVQCLRSLPVLRDLIETWLDVS